MAAGIIAVILAVYALSIWAGIALTAWVCGQLGAPHNVTVIAQVAVFVLMTFGGVTVKQNS